jgi:hypothetical protein
MPAQKQPSTIKGRMPAIIASLQAMRSWPAIEPGDLHCPLLLLVGTKNASVLKWAQSNREALAAVAAQVEMVEGLNHSQEFSKIDRVYPHVRPFLDRFAGGRG